MKREVSDSGRSVAGSGSSTNSIAAIRALQVACVYLLLGLLWVSGSDALLLEWIQDPVWLARLQTWKGGAYVALTAALLWLALYRLFRKDAERLQQQKRLGDELYWLGQFRESIIDNANVWINVLDAQARIMVWNKAAETISGYRRDEVLDSAEIWAKLYPDDAYRAEITARVRAILQDGYEVEGFETRMRCRDGQYKIMSWNQRRFVDADGAIGSIAIGQDITERKRLQRELERMAMHDALTGLYSRRQFVLLARDELDACNAEGLAFSLLWVDVDGFKGVNDRLGHQVGDEVLQKIAAMLQVRAGERGIAARYGGDEMVLALPDCTPAQAIAAAEAMRLQVEAAGLLRAHEAGHVQTVSIGVADNSQASGLEALLKIADQAMYRAKSAGRNRVCTLVGAGTPPA